MSAQNETKEITDEAGLVAAIKGVSQIAAANDLKAEADRLKSIADAVSPKYVTLTKTEKSSAVHDAIRKYNTAINQTSSADENTKILYALGKVRDSDADGWGEDESETTSFIYTLYVTIPGVSVSTDQKNAWGILGNFREVTPKVGCAAKIGNVEDKLALAFDADGNVPKISKDAVCPTRVVVVYESTATKGEVLCSDALDISTLAQNGRLGMFSTGMIGQCYALSLSLYNNESTYSTISVKEERVKDEYNEDVKTDAYKTAYDEYKAKNDEYNEAIENVKEYLSVTTLNIKNDFAVAKVSDLSGAILPAGVTLNGGNNSITGLGTTSLFAENKGEVVELIIDGALAAKNNGYADKVIAKANGKMRLYLENVATDYADAIALVNANSGVYGYDVTTDKIAPVTAANSLYTATYYTAANKGGETFYVNINNKNIVSKGSYSTDSNQFIYINDSRIAENTIEQQNVVVNGVCSEAKIVEGAGKAEFFIPADFTAKTLDYDRDITSDVASVCLPFTLGSDFAKDKGMSYYGYKGVDLDSKTVWFSKKTAVEANKPCVLAFAKDSKPGQIFKNLTKVQFKSTVGEDLALSPTDQSLGENGKRFRGNYKPGQSTGDLAEAAGNLGSDVYGFQNGKLVLLNEQARINQFRSFVIYSVDITKSAGAMLKAGFLDEDGDDVTAVESVNADRNDNGGLKAVGGNGVIEISADKACNVKVYTVGGTFVKSVNVEAGNTSLPVNAGLYIVNKNKVVVK